MSEVQEIKNYWVIPGIKPVTCVELFDSVVDRINEVSPSPITTKTRKREICEGRQLASYILKEKGYTSLYIGRRLGIDHATVYHGCNAVINFLIYDSNFIDRWRSILDYYKINYYDKQKLKFVKVEENKSKYPISCCFECIHYNTRELWCKARYIKAYDNKKPIDKCLKHKPKKVRNYEI